MRHATWCLVLLSTLILRGLVRDGRITRLTFEIDDTPGQLADISRIIGEAGANVVVEHNWSDGGGYTIYCGKDGSRGVSVRYNRFGRGLRYGPITGTCDQKVGNVWDDTGDPI